jgi:hypothetical protein
MLTTSGLTESPRAIPTVYSFCASVSNCAICSGIRVVKLKLTIVSVNGTGVLDGISIVVLPIWSVEVVSVSTWFVVVVVIVVVVGVVVVLVELTGFVVEVLSTRVVVVIVTIGVVVVEAATGVVVSIGVVVAT